MLEPTFTITRKGDFFGRLRDMEASVEVRRTGPGGGQWWEAIAAFDCRSAAEVYAKECSDGAFDKRLSYRVVVRSPRR